VENLDFLQKDVVLIGPAGAESTIVDGSQPVNPDRGSAVFLFNVGAGALVRGFTLRGGTGTRWVYGPFLAGGGACIVNSRDEGPVIEDNWITDNTADHGGGIYGGGVARVLRNRVINNTALDEGGGILFIEGTPTSPQRRIISENEVFSNHAGNWGGGVKLSDQPYRFSRNVVVCNEAIRGGAGLSAYSHAEENVVEGNTIVANYSSQGIGGVILRAAPGTSLLFRANAVVYNLGGGVQCSWQPGWGLPTFQCNDIHGNVPNFVDDLCGTIWGVNGNFNEDPLFAAGGCPPAAGDFCLQPGSPLLPENSPPGCGLVGAHGICAGVGVPAIELSRAADRLYLSAQPNPFAERTTVAFTLSGDAEVEVRIADARGGAIVELTPGRLAAGRHEIAWNGRDARGRRCPSGVYFARVQAGDQELIARLLILR
jgi:hypothetical protein